MHLPPNYLDLPALFRSQFRYVEQEGNLWPRGPLLNHFYESVGERLFVSCGYWNVFVRFYALLELRDRYFALYLESHASGPAPPLRATAPTLTIDAVLDVVHPRWRELLPALDRDNPLDMVKIYAAAIKPFAQDIFVPSVRPSEGFAGFAWWPAVNVSLAHAKA